MVARIKLRCLLLLVGAGLWAACSSLRPSAQVVELSGTVNPLQLEGKTCWILETGSMRDKAFYELRGSERLLKRLQRENARVRVRGLLRPTEPPTCGIGTCLEVVEILDIQP